MIARIIAWLIDMILGPIVKAIGWYDRRAMGVA